MGKKKTAEEKPVEEPKEVKAEAPPAEEEEEDSPKVKELKALDDRCLEIEKKFRAEVEVLRKKYSEEQEPILEERAKALAAKAEGADEASGTPGLPDFWLQALQRHPATEELVEEWDVPVLKYLRNVTRSYIDTTDPSKGFRLEFHFAENPYFTEEVLWKEYHIGEIAPYTEEVKVKDIAVCDISWKPGKNVTVEVVKTKPKGGNKKKAAKAQEKEEPRDSFFRNVFRHLKLGMPLPADMNLNDARQLCVPWVEITFEGDPQTVWAAPMAVDRLLDLAERRCDPSHNNRTVHFAGTEDPLTHAFGGTWALRNATVRRLQKYFRRIVYQTMDASMEGVQLAPMGLSWGYMVALSDALVRARRSPAYSAREFMGLVQNASRVDLSWKTKGVLATKSKVASWLDSSSVGKAVLEARRRGPANVIYFPATNSSASSVLDAWTSRAGMRRFVTTPMAKRAGVEWRGLAHPEWWAEMPKYRFLLSPMGSAIQTSKTYEALLALTVPITEHMGYAAFFDLVKMGFPLVVVDVWTQVTPENTTRWWKELSPRLEGFRKNCLTVDGYWKMITGQLRYCQ